MLFFGANIAENIDISANGGRVRFFRDVANVTMDLNDVEQIEFRALGGADNIVIGDLTGTDVTQVNIDLRGAERRRRRRGGHGHRQRHAGRRRFRRRGRRRRESTVSGLHAAVSIVLPGGGQRPADAQRASGGDDVINATGPAGRRHPAHR